MSLPRLLICAEASVEIGVGHVMRGMALGQAWQDQGGVVTILTGRLPPALTLRLQREGFQTREYFGDIASPEGQVAAKDAAEQEGARCIVLDGYGFGAEFQAALSGKKRQIIVVTDYVNADRYSADLIVNQIPGADPKPFRERAGNATLLFGHQYILLRREYRSRIASCGNAGARRGAGAILVTFGGGDAPNLTARVIDCLKSMDLKGRQVIVVTGPANPHRLAIAAVIERLKPRFALRHDVEDMPELLSQCDIALCAGGATCWELAFMGVVPLAIILADNQIPVAAAVAKLGIGYDLGWHHQLADDRIRSALGQLLDFPTQLAEMGARGRIVVDGRGPERVIQQIWPQPET